MKFVQVASVTLVRMFIPAKYDQSAAITAMSAFRNAKLRR